MMLMTMCLAGCAKEPAKTPTVAPTTQAVETEATTEAVEETTEAETEIAEEVTLVKIGKYVRTDNDSNDNPIYAVFTDETDQEFIAVLNDELELPELIEGEMYTIEHGEMMTMSIPPQYPQIKSIVMGVEEEVLEPELPNVDGEPSEGEAPAASADVEADVDAETAADIETEVVETETKKAE